MMEPNFNINRYFANIFSNQSIFKNRDVLRPSHIPEKLIFRDEEIEKIAQVVGTALTNAISSNLFIYGQTGTGKTAVVHYHGAAQAFLVGNIFGDAEAPLDTEPPAVDVILPIPTDSYYFIILNP